jgi:hypothetical protein
MLYLVGSGGGAYLILFLCDRHGGQNSECHVRSLRECSGASIHPNHHRQSWGHCSCNPNLPRNPGGHGEPHKRFAALGSTRRNTCSSFWNGLQAGYRWLHSQLYVTIATQGRHYWFELLVYGHRKYWSSLDFVYGLGRGAELHLGLSDKCDRNNERCIA